MNEQLEEQASLYALDLLEPEEVRAFEAQMTENPALRDKVDEFRAIAASLAHGALTHPLPAHLETKVLSAIRGEALPQFSPVAPTTNWIPWALAASLAVACLITFADRQRTTQKLASAEEQTSAAQQKVLELTEERDRAETAVAQLQASEANSRTQLAALTAARDEATRKLALVESRDPLLEVQIAALTSKLDSAPDATASVIWDEKGQRGVLNTSTMPANPTDRDYQLWIVDPNYGQPVDAGVFSVEKGGKARFAFKPKSRIDSATAFAISLERKGGVPKAEGPIVLVGK